MRLKRFPQEIVVLKRIRGPKKKKMKKAKTVTK